MPHKDPEKERERQCRFRKEHPEKSREYTKRWRAKNPERAKAITKQWREENKDRFLAIQRKYRDNGGREREKERQMRRFYGIGFAEYEAMLAAQDGVCGICRGTEPTGAMFNVDHDHTTGAVRGLLCRKCNVAIGLLGDDPGRVTAAVNYLMRHKR